MLTLVQLPKILTWSDTQIWSNFSIANDGIKTSI